MRFDEIAKLWIQIESSKTNNGLSSELEDFMNFKSLASNLGNTLSPLTREKRS